MHSCTYIRQLCRPSIPVDTHLDTSAEFLTRELRLSPSHFDFRCMVFSSQLKSKVGHIHTKKRTLLGEPITKDSPHKRTRDYRMYSTFLTVLSGSVLFRRSNLLKRKDLHFSRSSGWVLQDTVEVEDPHTFSQVFVNIPLPRPVFCDWFAEGNTARSAKPKKQVSQQ